MDGFRKMAEVALINNPNDSDVLAHFGLRLALSGDWDRGFSLLDKAVLLNPAYPRWYRFAWVLYHFDRREYELALQETEKINMASFFWTYLIKAAALAQLGRQQEAHAAVEQLLVLNENFRNDGRAQIEAWHMPEPLASALVDGLEKAGLRLEDHQKQ
jgi:tetratricopeptide (TPR) repeat protein